SGRSPRFFAAAASTTSCCGRTRRRCPRSPPISPAAPARRNVVHWLFPGFLVGAWAIALPILLHLLRRRPRRTIAFPSLRFLATTPPQNAKSQQLRRWIVLLLRGAALALLAAAFARPFFGASRVGDRRATVVVVDNSFSLQAGRRWPELRAWAREQIGEIN